ncbi:hypothetical protein AmaxDRAFT_0218 [Limnospira maxima CS-328]|uniref:Uncharacterized protein n=2 Tax=Limnospira maxima TaxID=129910 RepID=B5VUH3_LIMMA|nr:hypothetical protein AmaxDRAFT_0218 [Limnospira maxima CS-328]
MTLTETAVKVLDQMAIELNLTRSELVEQIARGIISSQGGKVSPEQAENFKPAGSVQTKKAESLSQKGI